MVNGEAPPWRTEGPVQAEVFVLARDGEGIKLTGPCGADAWYLEVGEDDVTVQQVLDAGWLQALQSYVPEPFRNLGSSGSGTSVQPRAS